MKLFGIKHNGNHVRALLQKDFLIRRRQWVSDTFFKSFSLSRGLYTDQYLLNLQKIQVAKKSKLQKNSKLQKSQFRKVILISFQFQKGIT